MSKKNWYSMMAVLVIMLRLCFLPAAALQLRHLQGRKLLGGSGRSILMVGWSW